MNIAKYGITEIDIDFFNKIGKPLNDAVSELKTLKEQHSYVKVINAANFTDDTLLQISFYELNKLLSYYTEEVVKKNNLIFIPSSGAASRQTQLFKSIYRDEFKDCSTVEEIKKSACECVSNLIDLRNSGQLNDEETSTLKLMDEIKNNLETAWNTGIAAKKFGFISNLEIVMKKNGKDLNQAILDNDIKTVFHFIMDKKDGLGFEFLPKALIPFHAYKEQDGNISSRTLIEEHIRIWLKLFKGSEKYRYHFTISEEHKSFFEKEISQILDREDIKILFKQNRMPPENLSIDYSYQLKSTDAVSLDVKTGKIARDENGLPVMRKAGHGALIQNLSKHKNITGLWVQTIDNIPQQTGKSAIIEMDIIFKKVLAAKAYMLNEQSQSYLSVLNSQKSISTDFIDEIYNFICKELTVSIEEEIWEDLAKKRKIEILQQILDRPILVSGFVPLAKGQTGGGPFIIRKKFNSVSIINSNTVESTEFEGGQNNCFVTQKSSHFNPVNFFIANERYDGTTYDLTKFVDKTRCFISDKTDSRGRPVKAFER
ncbi:MAG: DUF4301 family protein, partial [Chitinispirillia bacterium]